MKRTFYIEYLSKLPIFPFIPACSLAVTVFALHAVHAAKQQTIPTFPPNTSIETIVVSGNNIFVGTQLAGIFLSTNNGTTWTEINNGLPDNCSIYSIVVSNDTVFAGSSFGNVFLSTNGGTTWTKTNNGLPEDSHIFCLAVNDGNLFAGTQDKGIFLSTNNGTTWTEANNGLPDNCNVWSLVTTSDRIFCGTKNGIFSSTDLGTTWNFIRNGPPNNALVHSLAVNGNKIFAATSSDVIYRSTDKGTTWTVVNYTNPGGTITISRDLIFIGGMSVFYSNTQGTTWTEVDNNSLSIITPIFSIAVSDSTIFLGGPEGIAQLHLSEFTEYITLELQQDYDMPVNYYNFSWNAVAGATWYDIYGNDVPVCRTQNQTSTTNLTTIAVIDSIKRATGKSLEFGDTVQFYVVARTASDQIVGISNFVHKEFIMYIHIQYPKVKRHISDFHISGSLIDCSSLKGVVRLSLYSLSGQTVWQTTGIGVKSGVPEHLPKGMYTLQVSGSFGKTNRIIVKK